MSNNETTGSEDTDDMEDFFEDLLKKDDEKSGSGEERKGTRKEYASSGSEIIAYYIGTVNYTKVVFVAKIIPKKGKEYIGWSLLEQDNRRIITDFLRAAGASIEDYADVVNGNYWFKIEIIDKFEVKNPERYVKKMLKNVDPLDKTEEMDDEKILDMDVEKLGEIEIDDETRVMGDEVEAYYRAPRGLFAVPLLPLGFKGTRWNVTGKIGNDIIRVLEAKGIDPSKYVKKNDRVDGLEYTYVQARDGYFKNHYVYGDGTFQMLLDTLKNKTSATKKKENIDEGDLLDIELEKLENMTDDTGEKAEEKDEVEVFYRAQKGVYAFSLLPLGKDGEKCELIRDFGEDIMKVLQAKNVEEGKYIEKFGLSYSVVKAKSIGYYLDYCKSKERVDESFDRFLKNLRGESREEERKHDEKMARVLVREGDSSLRELDLLPIDNIKGISEISKYISEKEAVDIQTILVKRGLNPTNYILMIHEPVTSGYPYGIKIGNHDKMVFVDGKEFKSEEARDEYFKGVLEGIQDVQEIEGKSRIPIDIEIEENAVEPMVKVSFMDGDDVYMGIIVPLSVGKPLNLGKRERKEDIGLYDCEEEIGDDLAELLRQLELNPDWYLEVDEPKGFVVGRGKKTYSYYMRGKKKITAHILQRFVTTHPPKIVD